VLVAGVGEDPLEAHAHELGLSPVSGEIERLAPPLADSLTVSRTQSGLALRHPLGTDTVCAEPAEVDDWWRAAEGEALVVTARGLGLRRAERANEEAVRLRPAWAAVATLEDFAPQSRVRGAAQRFARKLLRPAPR